MTLHIPKQPEPQEIKNALPERFMMQIPQCCREGWPDCPHVAKKDRIKRRKNIGL